MIPLATAGLPDTAQTLEKAIREGLARHGLEAKQVSAEGGAFPKLERLRIDLTNAKVGRETRLPKADGVDGEQIFVQDLQIAAQPLLVEGVPVQIYLTAQGVTFSLEKGTADESILVLRSAREGRLEVIAQKADLQQAAQAFATEAGASRGVEIKETHFELTSRGPRALSFRAGVVAKMMIVKAPVTLTGDLDVNDALELRFSNLDLSASGIAANLAGSFIRPHLEKIQKQPIPLGIAALGTVRLRDVEVEAGERIAIRARFGDAGPT